MSVVRAAFGMALLVGSRISTSPIPRWPSLSRS